MLGSGLTVHLSSSQTGVRETLMIITTISAVYRLIMEVNHNILSILRVKGEVIKGRYAETFWSLQQHGFGFVYLRLNSVFFGVYRWPMLGWLGVLLVTSIDLCQKGPINPELTLRCASNTHIWWRSDNMAVCILGSPTCKIKGLSIETSCAVNQFFWVWLSCISHTFRSICVSLSQGFWGKP